jgi:hypothetical protein
VTVAQVWFSSWMRTRSFGLDGLVQPVGPPSSVQGSAGELVNDLHFAGVHQVVLVAEVELFGAQRLAQLVHVVRGHGVVEVGDAELLLDLLDARLRRHHRLLLFVDLVVDVSNQRSRDRGELVVELGDVRGRAGDDERRAGLVDQDRVDLVDDRVVVAALHHVFGASGHVVAQVVEAELGVGAVGDVAGVGRALVLELRKVRPDSSHGESEERVQGAHPVGVAGGQVVVHRDDVHAVAGQRVEVDRQRRHQGLALAGLHLGDPPEVQGHAPHELDVVVTLAEDARRGLAYHGEGLEQHVVQVLTFGESGAELVGLGAKLGVREGRHLVGEFVDGRHEFGQLAYALALSGLQNLAKNTHNLMYPTGRYCYFDWAASADLVFYPTLACGGVRGSRRQHEALRRGNRTLHRLSR